MAQSAHLSLPIETTDITKPLMAQSVHLCLPIETADHHEDTKKLNLFTWVYLQLYAIPSDVTSLDLISLQREE